METIICCFLRRVFSPYVTLICWFSFLRFCAALLPFPLSIFPFPSQRCTKTPMPAPQKSFGLVSCAELLPHWLKRSLWSCLRRAGKDVSIAGRAGITEIIFLRHLCHTYPLSQVSVSYRWGSPWPPSLTAPLGSAQAVPVVAPGPCGAILLLVQLAPSSQLTSCMQYSWTPARGSWDLDFSHVSTSFGFL